jgi:hypothetical protein
MQREIAHTLTFAALGTVFSGLVPAASGLAPSQGRAIHQVAPRKCPPMPHTSTARTVLLMLAHARPEALPA